MEWLSHSEEETRKLAGQLVAGLNPSATISLNGTLGAGKSVFVRGFAESLGIDPTDVTSPTFTLWHTYRGTVPLHHLDAYRLEMVDEFYDMGGEELFEMPGLKLIEWGDRIVEALPRQYLHLQIEVVDTEKRHLVLTPHGGLEVNWPEDESRE